MSTFSVPFPNKIVELNERLVEYNSPQLKFARAQSLGDETKYAERLCIKGRSVGLDEVWAEK